MYVLGGYRDEEHVGVLDEVEARLLEPLEVAGRADLAVLADVVEDVALVHVDGDERLEFGALDRREIARRLRDEQVQEAEERLVRLLHDLPVVLGVLQRLRRVARPDQLDAQDAHLHVRVRVHTQ